MCAHWRVCCDGAGMAERRPLAAVAEERDEPQDQHWKTDSHGGVRSSRTGLRPGLHGADVRVKIAGVSCAALRR
jgi:hypothetical protein